MRTIKFRGKRVDTKEWVYGYYWVNKSATRETPHIVDEYGDIFQIDTETVGQYTGLYDKNGTEIYEGDIIQINQKMSSMCLNTGTSTSWENNFKEEVKFTPSGLQLIDYYVRCCHFIIIGNIHDNKELLK